MRHFVSEVSEHGINFLDVGCSGSLGKRWRPLQPLLNFVGFEPNRAEITRLENTPHPYRSAKFLPYAVAGEEGDATMFQTASPYCYSLRRPRHQWLKRFEFHELFRETGQCQVPVVTLDHVEVKEGITADVFKLDTQGMELPILQSASNILADAFCVETETGFVENYESESVTAEVDQFMRAAGFNMFDQKVYRVGRSNRLGVTGCRQPLWCEVVWLKDRVASGQDSAEQLDRTSALKSLLICWSLGICDYGLELAEFYHELGLLDGDDMNLLRGPRIWRSRRSGGGTLVPLLRLLPKRWRSGIADAAELAKEMPHLLRSA